MPNIDGSFRIQEPLGGMFFVELYLERLPLIEDDGRRRGPALCRPATAIPRLCKALDARAYEEVRDRPSFIRYTNWLSVLLRNVELFSPTAKDWSDDTAAFLEAWLKLADRYGVYQNESFTLNTMIARMANQSAQLDRVGFAGQWVVASSDAERLRAAFGKMAAHRRKAIAVLGQAALFMSDVTWRQPVEDDVAEDFQKLLGRAKAAIGDPGPGDPRETRVICYYALLGRDRIAARAGGPPPPVPRAAGLHARPRRIGLWGGPGRQRADPRGATTIMRRICIGRWGGGAVGRRRPPSTTPWRPRRGGCWSSSTSTPPSVSTARRAGSATG